MHVVYEEARAALSRLYYYAECVVVELNDTATKQHYNVVVHYPDAFSRQVGVYFGIDAKLAHENRE